MSELKQQSLMGRAVASRARRLVARGTCTFLAGIVVSALILGIAPNSGAATPSAFVGSNGTSLTLNGQPYTFVGLNVYQAADGGTPTSCGGGLYPNVGVPLADMPNGVVIRFWAFQNYFVSNGTFNWTNFDQVLTIAAAHDDKVIPVLANQYDYCDGPAKDLAWYQSGYENTTESGDIVPYLQYVSAVVSRYADNPTIAMWQMVNEGEARNPDGSCTESAAHSALLAFSNTVGGEIHSLDPNHLVSLGVLAGYSGSGGQWCGAADGDFQTLMASPGTDVCDYHDYGYPSAPMGLSDGQNLAAALAMCHADGKPLMVAENGIMADNASELATRASEFSAKLSAQYSAGVVGELLWAWAPNEEYALPETQADLCIFPGDPTLGVLQAFVSSTPTTTNSSSTTTTTVPPTTTTLETTQTTVPLTTNVSATTTSAPAKTTTTTTPPKPTINVSAARLGAKNNIVATVRCAVARCSGTLEPTKHVTAKVKIGHSTKYTVSTTVAVLGRLNFAMAKGSHRKFSIPLNALGVRLLHEANGRLKCVLTVKSSTGEKHERLSLRIP